MKSLQQICPSRQQHNMMITRRQRRAPPPLVSRVLVVPLFLHGGGKDSQNIFLINLNYTVNTQEPFCLGNFHLEKCERSCSHIN